MVPTETPVRSGTSVKYSDTPDAELLSSRGTALFLCGFGRISCLPSLCGFSGTALSVLQWEFVEYWSGGKRSDDTTKPIDEPALTVVSVPERPLQLGNLMHLPV